MFCNLMLATGYSFTPALEVKLNIYFLLGSTTMCISVLC